MRALVSETVEFPSGHRAQLLRVKRETEPKEILTALQLPTPRALVLLNGGTAKLSVDLEARLRSLLHEGLARIAAEEQITLLTGGTDAGIFSLLGEGIAKWQPAVSCIGVVPSGPIRWPGQTSGDASLEPHHSHFVVVEGENWGDETATMYALAAAFTCPSLAVFAGGGSITLREMQANVEQRRGMILIAGSGRNTDVVLAARAGSSVDDSLVQSIARDGLITSFALGDDPAKFIRLLKARLVPR